MNDATCESCQNTAGTPHSFHYGRKARLPEAEPPPAYRAEMVGNLHTTWTEHFEVGGVDAAVLCSRCLTRARVRRAGSLLLRTSLGQPLALVFYVLWASGVVVWAWQGDWTQTALWAAAGLLVTVAAYAAIYLTLQKEDFAQQLAVDLHRERLRDEGWNTFWTDREFTGLTPH